MSFSKLGLSEPILAGVARAGYESPTEIQTRAVPLALSGRDLIGLGETGSGKTAAYGLPILERLLRSPPGLRALILVPTRELCVQVAENLRGYASQTELAVCTAFGGIPITIQEAAFRRGLDVLVACPGRLIDHLTCGNVSLDRIETLVLDEADRMLDMGFIPQIRRILSRLPSERQNCMYSATMPAEVDRLVLDYFGEAELVQVGNRSQAPSTITHRFESTHASDKLELLKRLLRKRSGRVLIFVKTKVRAEELGRKLKATGLPADSIHGDKSAESRHVVLQAFSRGKTRFMVATDVAARGIDVTDIELVVNCDMPKVLEDYVHRVGRTGRAGSEGEALSLVTRLDSGLQKQIIRHLGETSDQQARIIVDGVEVRSGSVRPERRDRPPHRERERDRGRERKKERQPADRAPRRNGSPREHREHRDLAARTDVSLARRKARPREDDGSDVLFGDDPPPSKR